MIVIIIMNYVAALLLGLVAVKAQFQNTPINFQYFTLTQVYDWDVEYGTYYEASQDDKTEVAPLHYENYGPYFDLYAYAEYIFNFDNGYTFDITFKLHPVYIAPADILISFERYMETQNPVYYYQQSFNCRFLYLETFYTESANTFVHSLK